MLRLPFFPQRACTALVALALASGAAAAADLFPVQTPVRGYVWQGPYVGANLGYQWGSVTRNPSEPSGVTGGLQAGYNFQSGAWVFGAETDIQLSAANDRFAPWKFSNPWFGTLRGRVGYAMNNILFYGTGGLAYGTLRGENMLIGMSQSTTEVGWTVGAGLEVALTGPWRVRTEYLYVDLNERPYFVTGASNGLESHVVRFGVNYRF